MKNRIILPAILAVTILIGGTFFGTVILADEHTSQGKSSEEISSPIQQLGSTVLGLANFVDEMQKRISGLESQIYDMQHISGESIHH